MNRQTSGILRVPAAAAVLACTWLAAVASAEEPAAEFLEALRQRGYFQVANDYLERMQKSPMVTQEFRERILYEQGLTLMAVSRLERDFDKRQALLNDAQKNFQDFLVAHKNHDMAPKAKSELANVLVERARVKVAEAKRPQNEAQKPQLMKEAQKFFDDGKVAFADSQEEIAAKLKGMPPLDPQKDAKRIAYRDELRGDYVKVQMVQAVILYEKADTALDEKEKIELLKNAAEAYGGIYEKYRRRLAGLYARMHQGRCYQEMGGEKNIAEALTYYEELLEQPDKPDPFRVLRTKTMVKTLECWLDPSQDKFEKAITIATPWATQVRPNETKDNDWIELHYQLARAYKVKADKQEEPARRKTLSDGKRFLDFGLKNASGEMESKFQELNLEYGGKGPKKDDRPEPTNFAEAYQAGRETLEEIQTTGTTVELLKKRLPKAAADEKKEIEQQIATSQEQMQTGREDALKYFRMALGMANTDTSIDDVNNTRYYLCFLHYSQSDHYAAATLGEFIARHFPGTSGGKGGRDCAQIALASYVNLYQELTDEQKKEKTNFESAKIVDMANLITEEWPDEPEAESALVTLIKFMVKQKNLEKAEEYLARIDKESPGRGEAELTTGQAMWGEYLTGVGEIRKWQSGDEPQPAGVDLKAREEELDLLKTKAQQTLRDGIQRMREKGIDKTLASAVLSLAQIYVDGGQAGEAVKLMEDPKIGAITLVKENHEAVQRDGYAQETYRTALRAYIGSLPGATDKAALMAKAEGAMDALNSSVADDEEGREKLINIYITLANEVEEQINLAPASNRPALTQGFATFLDKMGKSSEQFNVMNWVAEQFRALGEANASGKGELSESVKGYFVKAEDAYGRILQKAQTDKTITPKIALQIRLRLADVRRRLGNYVGAMDQLEIVLKPKERNMMLNVQVQAAETYQEWGKVGVSKLYLVAIKGGRKNKDTEPAQWTLWGWNKMAQMLSRQISKNPETKDQFYGTLHQAKYNAAMCYYQYGLRQDDQSKKRKFLQYAKDDIRLTQRSYPDLGGPEWKRKYEELLKDIQTKMGEDPVGLQAFAAVSP